MNRWVQFEANIDVEAGSAGVNINGTNKDSKGIAASQTSTRRGKYAMQERSLFFSRRPILLFSLIAVAGLCAGRANAGPVFMWVAEGSSGVFGYDASGAQVTALSAPAGSPNNGVWGNAFALAVDGSNNVFVSDSANHSLAEYTYNGSTAAQTGTTVLFPSDPAGGAISPQEIAIDSVGNLWTTSLDGNIVQYNGINGTTTTMQSGGATLDARGILIDGSAVYVSTSNYGAANVVQFTTTQNSTVSTAYTSLATTGGQEGGQLRGITYDSNGDIYYADSTWGQTTGYIDENGSSFATGLSGPNQLEVAAGAGGSNGNAACDYLYVANYYSGDISMYDTSYQTNGTQNTGTCGTSGTLLTADFLTTSLGSGVLSGLAITNNNSALGDVAGTPTFISAPSAPEPGTFVLMPGALLLALAAGIRQKRRRLQ
jgi:hypothetical protein